MKLRVAKRARYAALLTLVMVIAATGGVSAAGCTDSGGRANAGGEFDDKVDGYVALVPNVLRAGETASFAFTLTHGNNPARSSVNVSLTDKEKTIVEAVARVEGKGTVAFELPPDVAPGEYTVEVSAAGFREETRVRVEPGMLLFLETDKPIYKPGQTIQVRLVALNSELKPVSSEATLEVQDAKGIKIAKQVLTTDVYGMATMQLPLASEPNLGVWKVTASAGDASTQLDVRVEEYVLPKYEVKADLAKEWFLVDETISGQVSSKYSYGLIVEGELKVIASRYIGEWEEYATYTAPIRGQAPFSIDAAGYVAGVPEAGGMGNVKLDITVTEKATGYQQTITELLTVAASSLNLQIIPEGGTFKPGLPFSILVVTETPGGEPVEADVALDIWYYDDKYRDAGHQVRNVQTSRGTGLIKLRPPADAVNMNLSASSGSAYAGTQLASSYSPSGSFIHVQQTGDLELSVGDTASFHVNSTTRAQTFYYEVVARGRVVFTSSGADDILFKVTPAMAPAAKLLVYQILPSGEVAADALPFNVQGEYPQKVTAEFDAPQARPGDKVQVQVQTEGPAKVGVVAVDRSVFVLAENRLNLQQVFAELERLYMRPQAELHEGGMMWDLPTFIPGAKETFESAGLIVLSNKKVPEGKELEQAMKRAEDGVFFGAEVTAAAQASTAAGQAVTGSAGRGDEGGLAEVERVRQFFPETWIWGETLTDQSGRATLVYEAPDSITTWDLRAVAMSADKGLGIGEASLVVFQPFFLQADLPYSAIRGEEFPVKIALCNYLDRPQEIQVQLEKDSWFELLDADTSVVTVAAGDVGSAEFRIRPKSIGTQLLKVSARSAEAADAVIKSMIVEPEGLARETLVNTVVPAGQSRTLELLLPNLLEAGVASIVPDSARAYVAVTGSLLAQAVEGLDQLLAMPFGCGEQNMILFAPDAFILKYLKSTRQLKPEIQAKAEMLLITGYQRELTYRHKDGSFSAFGEQDESGSLWLTAFVLKTFAQAKELTFIDEAVLKDAADWIVSHQNADGSFESVGFVCHSEMMGGVSGKDTLTAYVAIALMEAGYDDAAAKAIKYLEGRVDVLGDDAYGLALATYALQLAGSPEAPGALAALLDLAVRDDDGLHWSAGVAPLDGGLEIAPGLRQGGPGMPNGLLPSLDIEATGYGALALLGAGERLEAAEATKWLVGRRNSQGGFGTTQDTVVACRHLPSSQRKGRVTPTWWSPLRRVPCVRR